MTHRLALALGRLPVKVRRGLARGAWWSIYPCSAYWRLGGNDPDVDECLNRHAARPGTVCWDIGAHHGIYSVGLARRVGSSGFVEAFEPDPVSFDRLDWHKRINRLGNLRIHPVAVSDHSGDARLYQYDGFGATTSHLPFPGENLETVASRPITTARLDDWVRDRRIRAPDFIKLDVEGHAVPALRGMQETLARARPTILLAVHSAEERDEGGALLSRLGYTLDPVSVADAERIARDAFGELVARHPAR